MITTDSITDIPTLYITESLDALFFGRENRQASGVTIARAGIHQLDGGTELSLPPYTPGSQPHTDAWSGNQWQPGYIALAGQRALTVRVDWTYRHTLWRKRWREVWENHGSEEDPLWVFVGMELIEDSTTVTNEDFEWDRGGTSPSLATVLGWPDSPSSVWAGTTEEEEQTANGNVVKWEKNRRECKIRLRYRTPRGAKGGPENIAVTFEPGGSLSQALHPFTLEHWSAAGDFVGEQDYELPADGEPAGLTAVGYQFF